MGETWQCLSRCGLVSNVTLSIMARDSRIDSIKGLLIILVILGHVITTLDNNNFINHGVMGLIYVFHMPLFILISGYLTKNPDQQSAQGMWKGVLRIFIPLVIFHVLSSIRVSLTGGSFRNAMIYFPYGVLWYLMCLIYWRVILYYTPRPLRQRPLLYLGIAFLVTMMCGFTKLGNILSIQRGLNFYTFFLLGYYYRQGQLSTRWWKANALHGILALVLLPTIFLLYPRCGNIMNGADYYTFKDLPEKFLIVTCSVAMSLLVFNLMREVKWLTSLGIDSLFYYLYHYFIIALVITPLVDYFNLPLTFPFILIYTAVIIAIIYLMGKIKIFRWLVHPGRENKPSEKQIKTN